MVSLLLSRHASTNIKDGRGKTALNLALHLVSGGREGGRGEGGREGGRGEGGRGEGGRRGEERRWREGHASTTINVKDGRGKTALNLAFTSGELGGGGGGGGGREGGGMEGEGGRVKEGGGVYGHIRTPP